MARAGAATVAGRPTTPFALSPACTLAPHLLLPLPCAFTTPGADGWGFSQMGNNPMGPSPNALKYQIIGLLHAAAYMRGAWPRGCCHFAVDE